MEFVLGCWLWAWASLIAFYCGQQYWPNSSAADWRQLVLIVIANLNSVLLICANYTILRGTETSKHEGVTYARIGTIVVIVIDFVLFQAGRSLYPNPADDSRVFLRFWSGCLSTVAPIVLGLAIFMRYGLTRVLVLSIAYSLLQPFGYVAAFNIDPLQKKTLPIDQDLVVQILTTLQLRLPSTAAAPAAKSDMVILNELFDSRDRKFAFVEQDKNGNYNLAFIGATANGRIDSESLARIESVLKMHFSRDHVLQTYLILNLYNIVFIIIALFKVMYSASFLDALTYCPKDLGDCLEPKLRVDDEHRFVVVNPRLITGHEVVFGLLIVCVLAVHGVFWPWYLISAVAGLPRIIIANKAPLAAFIKKLRR